LLDKSPNDIDLTTDATDEEILSLFPEAILAGQVFGVYKIPFKRHQTQDTVIVDLTVFRKEDEYIDGRRPLKVERSTPEEDARRRDFTMNSLFYDLKNRCVIDYCLGISDINDRILKCVGDPEKRFKEDHLRLLRLIRFSFQLGFKIEDSTYQAAYKLANLISTVSGERIQDELNKLVKSLVLSFKESEYLLFWQNDLTKEIFKSLGFEYRVSQSHLESRFKISFDTYKEYQISYKDFFVQSLWLVFEEDFEKTEKFLIQMKFSKKEIIYLNKIKQIKEKLNNLNNKEYSLAVQLSKVSELNEKVQSLYIYSYFAEVGYFSETLIVKALNLISEIPEPLLQGSELAQLGYRAEIKDILDLIRELQFCRKLQSKDQALDYVNSTFKDIKSTQKQ
ncbi:MAG: hypothetical protein ACK41T_10135, partial [Pseudobdellovibrio sp.]